MYKIFFSLFAGLIYFLFNLATAAEIPQMSLGTWSKDKTKSRQYPFMVTTSDLGYTWTVDNTLPPDFLDEGIFLSNSCNTNLCVATGVYRSKAAPNDPSTFIAFKKTEDTVWTYFSQADLDHISKPAGFKKFVPMQSRFRSNRVACTPSLCMVAMTYEHTNGNILPMFIASQDQGKTWQSSIIPGLADKEKNLTVRLQDLSCENNQCITAGAYTVGTHPSQVYLSTNSNPLTQPWSLSIQSDPTLSMLSYGSMRAMCHANTCLVVANFYPTNAPTRNSLDQGVLTSQDFGKTWTPIELLHFPTGDLIAWRTGLARSNNTWFISGIMNHKEQLIMNTLNGQPGHWVPVPDAQTTTEYDHSANALDCIANQCLFVVIDDHDNPWSFLSKDSGATWTASKIVSPHRMDLNGSDLTCNEKTCILDANFTNQTHALVVFDNKNPQQGWVFPNIQGLPKDLIQSYFSAYSNRGY